MRRLIAAVLTVAGMVVEGSAAAEDFAPAIVFDMGGKLDESFNAAAYDGAERYKVETGIRYLEFEVAAPATREQTIREAARNGAHIVVAMGFSQAAAVEAVAREFPDTRFTLIDMVVNLPNVQSVIFKEHEGSFLVGMAAAMASKTGKIGFIGGMDVPLIRRFALGYEEGAKHVNPDIEIFQSMTGTRGVERSGEGRRTRAPPVRSRGRRGLCGGRRYGHWRLQSREGRRQAGSRGR